MIENCEFGKMVVQKYNELAPRKKTAGAFHLSP
jgi:hypothetical protein